MSNNNIGPDGVLQIYPTIKDGIEVYMTIDPDAGNFGDTKRFNVSYGIRSHINYEVKKDGEFAYFRYRRTSNRL